MSPFLAFTMTPEAIETNVLGMGSLGLFDLLARLRFSISLSVLKSVILICARILTTAGKTVCSIGAMLVSAGEEAKLIVLCSRKKEKRHRREMIFKSIFIWLSLLITAIPAKKRGNGFPVFMLRKSKAFACTKGGEPRSPPLESPIAKCSAGIAETIAYYASFLLMDSIC